MDVADYAFLVGEVGIQTVLVDAVLVAVPETLKFPLFRVGQRFLYGVHQLDTDLRGVVLAEQAEDNKIQKILVPHIGQQHGGHQDDHFQIVGYLLGRVEGLQKRRHALVRECIDQAAGYALGVDLHEIVHDHDELLLVLQNALKLRQLELFLALQLDDIVDDVPVLAEQVALMDVVSYEGEA